jgi:hypothetical protein
MMSSTIWAFCDWGSGNWTPCIHCHGRERIVRCDCSPNMWYRIWWHPVSTVWHNLSPLRTRPVHAYECTVSSHRYNAAPKKSICFGDHVCLDRVVWRGPILDNIQSVFILYNSRVGFKVWMNVFCSSYWTLTRLGSGNLEDDLKNYICQQHRQFALDPLPENRTYNVLQVRML